MKADIFRAKIRYYMNLQHVNRLEDLRQMTRIGSNTTFLKNWKNPDRFTQGDVEGMMRGLEMPKEEMLTWTR